MADKSDDTVVPIGTSKKAARKRKPALPPAPVPAGPYCSPSLIPALDRYSELLARYGQPGDTGADTINRMPPADQREAQQLADCLEPALGPRILAALGA